MKITLTFLHFTYVWMNIAYVCRVVGNWNHCIDCVHVGEAQKWSGCVCVWMVKSQIHNYNHHFRCLSHILELHAQCNKWLMSYDSTLFASHIKLNIPTCRSHFMRYAHFSSFSVSLSLFYFSLFAFNSIWKGLNETKLKWECHECDADDGKTIFISQRKVIKNSISVLNFCVNITDEIEIKCTT